ncbi:cholesterol transport system auxiliary component [Halomonas campaniensis]|uniref:Cholesterol transport system auxiliary component n=1 Tax=Halomonas campaniensis TaxID=213554 RepID=A0A7W5PAQ1_9GAMM|nr:ABC-type transport auxiliary lipoprotein family protein [Halomonas campaniensis]MBB3330890.1 cholesterol transport system auxiliary component [Halomonas campaniensis]
MIRTALIAALLLALPACSILPERAPLQIHVLPVTPAEPSSHAAIDATLRVEAPEANALLSGSRILVMPTPNRMSVYEGARWSDPTPTLLRDRVIEAFLQAGYLTAVLDESGRLETDVALASDLRAFHSEYVEGRPEVVIRLDARLEDEAQRRLLASRRFEVREPSEGVPVEAVVEAFGRAADRLAQALVEWSHEVIDAR